QLNLNLCRFSLLPQFGARGCVPGEGARIRFGWRLNPRKDEITTGSEIRKRKTAVTFDKRLAVTQDVVRVLAFHRHKMDTSAVPYHGSFGPHASAQDGGILAHHDRNSAKTFAGFESHRSLPDSRSSSSRCR